MYAAPGAPFTYVICLAIRGCGKSCHSNKLLQIQATNRWRLVACREMTLICLLRTMSCLQSDSP